MKKRILIFSLIALLLLGACAKAPAQKYEYITEDSTGYAGVPELPRESLLMDEALEGYELGSSTQERLVIKTANMRVSVVDPVEAMWSVSQMATQLGGYVISSESSSSVNSSGEYKTASISIRIPTQKLDVAMEKIRQLSADGKDGVLSESTSGEDVTSDYVDTESRVRNLEAAEEQLMVLMENTTDLDKTMKVFRELTRTREEIEVLKGHMKYLRESASMSMISVNFVAEASIKPIEIGGWKPGVTARESLQKLIDIAQGIADVLIRFSIVCLPFLIPLGLGAFFVTKAVKKRRAKKQVQRANYYAKPPVIDPVEPEKKD
ncbi:MAG TPA: DUF4349 domain-containing protein [Anaerolineaceae bacterium]|nr:DUF4349 domain-containing protein [Anaerolineaceae bacterium]